MNTPASKKNPQSVSSVAPSLREETRLELARLPGKLKARLVVAALEAARGNGPDKARFLSDLVKRNNVSDTLFLELLKEFQSNLDESTVSKRQVNSRKGHSTKAREPAPNLGTNLGGGINRPTHKSEFAHSLNRENPIIGAALISRLRTHQAVSVLKIMRPDFSQRVALHLAEIEATNHKVPQVTQKVLEGHCLSLRD